jgi:hypothetical protein
VRIFNDKSEDYIFATKDSRMMGYNFYLTRNSHELERFRNKAFQLEDLILYFNG